MSDTTFPRPAKLAHVVLRTGEQFDEVVAWWKTVLGAHDVHDGGALVFMTYDDEHHRLAIVKDPMAGNEGRKHAGLEHVAFTYASLDDLVTTYERLRDAGIMPILPINHGMTLSLYYAAPDGTQCELQIDLASIQEAEAFMKSDMFAANPFGEIFDPEVLATQHRAGETVEALTIFGPNAIA